MKTQFNIVQIFESTQKKMYYYSINKKSFSRKNAGKSCTRLDCLKSGVWSVHAIFVIISGVRWWIDLKKKV